VEEANAGFQIEPENSKALADKILKLYQMPEEQLNKMGENGRKAVLEEYEYGMLAKKLAKVLVG
jgi:glycosyltransferase involved in cell wall biosynthesis